MKHILWFITDFCNYRCPYCDIAKPIASKNADFSWFSTYNPEHLGITGGEPFLVPNLIEVINAAPGKVHLTTNCSKDLTQFVQQTDPSKFTNITCSYHPTQTTMEPFIGKVLLLKNRNYPITVNVVAYPEQMWIINDLWEQFESMNINFHVDPCRQHDGKPYTYTEKELQYIHNITPSDRDHLLKSNVPLKVRCDAGTDHMIVDAQYKIYRCLSDKLYRPECSLGSVNSQYISPQPIICEYGNSCCGCDKPNCNITLI